MTLLKGDVVFSVYT